MTRPSLRLLMQRQVIRPPESTDQRPVSASGSAPPAADTASPKDDEKAALRAFAQSMLPPDMCGNRAAVSRLVRASRTQQLLLSSQQLREAFWIAEIKGRRRRGGASAAAGGGGGGQHSRLPMVVAIGDDGSKGRRLSTTTTASASDTALADEERRRDRSDEEDEEVPPYEGGVSRSRRKLHRNFHAALQLLAAGGTTTTSASGSGGPDVPGRSRGRESSVANATPKKAMFGLPPAAGHTTLPHDSREEVELAPAIAMAVRGLDAAAEAALRRGRRTYGVERSQYRSVAAYEAALAIEEDAALRIAGLDTTGNNGVGQHDEQQAPPGGNRTTMVPSVSAPTNPSTGKAPLPWNVVAQVKRHARSPSPHVSNDEIHATSSPSPALGELPPPQQFLCTSYDMRHPSEPVALGAITAGSNHECCREERSVRTCSHEAGPAKETVLEAFRRRRDILLQWASQGAAPIESEEDVVEGDGGPMPSGAAHEGTLVNPSGSSPSMNHLSPVSSLRTLGRVASAATVAQQQRMLSGIFTTPLPKSVSLRGVTGPRSEFSAATTATEVLQRVVDEARLRSRAAVVVVQARAKKAGNEMVNNNSVSRGGRLPDVASPGGSIARPCGGNVPSRSRATSAASLGPHRR